MTPEEFVTGLARGGMEFADDDPDYCPRHGWATGDLHLHHVECDAYAEKLASADPHPR